MIDVDVQIFVGDMMSLNDVTNDSITLRKCTK